MSNRMYILNVNLSRYFSISPITQQNVCIEGQSSFSFVLRITVTLLLQILV